eukprot:s935_g50.t1
MDDVAPLIAAFALLIIMGIAFLPALCNKSGDRWILELAERATIEQSFDVEALPEVILTSEETCVICLETMTCGESANKLSCGHVFHGDCIAGWWAREFRRKGTQNATCPVCRCEEPQMTAAPAKPCSAEVSGIVSTAV